MTALVDLDLGALVHITVQRLVRVIGTVRYLVANQMIINALSIGACELASGTGDVGLLTVHLVGMVSTVVLSVAPILISDAFEVLTGELVRGTGLVLRVAHLALICSVAAVVVVVAKPALKERRLCLKH